MDDNDETGSQFSDTYDDYSIEFDESIDIPQSELSSSNRPSKINCRICLKQCSYSSRDMQEYSEMYSNCTGFMIEDDDIPKKICDMCHNELQLVKKFIDKCSETEEQLRNFDKVQKKYEDSGDEIESIGEPEVVFEGDSDASNHSNFSDQLKKSTRKRGPPKAVSYRPEPKKKIIYVDENGEVIKPKMGRPRKDPSEKRIEIPKGPRGRPRLDPSLKKSKPLPIRGRGRPKGSTSRLTDEEMEIKVHKKEPLWEKQIIRDINEKGEITIKRDDGTIESRLEKQICYMCGKLVKIKHLPYHLWKHRKDEESGSEKTRNKQSGDKVPKCEFCHTTYKSEYQKQAHMARKHPAAQFIADDEYTVYQDEETIENEGDNFEKEFQVPPEQDDYHQIKSPYNHAQALHFLPHPRK